mmetsp:Transcript_18409/g.38034  ORF Transcript_18409/g.38034 Transcript_18409/m.38034 type:complete len:203 (-) Transcript_18409:126-734(-)
MKKTKIDIGVKSFLVSRRAIPWCNRGVLVKPVRVAFWRGPIFINIEHNPFDWWTPHSRDVARFAASFWWTPRYASGQLPLCHRNVGNGFRKAFTTHCNLWFQSKLCETRSWTMSRHYHRKGQPKTHKKNRMMGIRTTIQVPPIGSAIKMLVSVEKSWSPSVHFCPANPHLKVGKPFVHPLLVLNLVVVFWPTNVPACPIGPS